MIQSKWKNFLCYLNKFDEGEAIARESILLAVGGIAKYSNTVDTYRRVMTVNGYLSENTPYTILKKVPTDLVFMVLQRNAYGYLTKKQKRIKRELTAGDIKL
jgi:hypothetical protein